MKKEKLVYQCSNSTQRCDVGIKKVFKMTRAVISRSSRNSTNKRKKSTSYKHGLSDALVTYAHVYNNAYHMERRTINTWIMQNTQLCHSLQHRWRWTSRLLTLVHTQQIGKHVLPETVKHLVTQHRLAHIGRIVTYLRPLQRRILQYLWRPGGVLMMKHVLACRPL
jgi:hypothetical protein